MLCMQGTVLYRLQPAGKQQFPLELAYWLEQLPEESGIEVNVGDEVKEATFLKATTANAMSMGLMGDTVDQGVMYQLQIYAQYKVESEEE